MFRRIKPITHREEVIFPIDLKKLGYFVNDNDQLRKIEDPEQSFQYKFHKIERVNERHREAIDECLRRILDKRFIEEGLTKQYLPPGSDPTTKEKCLPVLVSNDIDKAEKVLVVIGNKVDDLGVWSVREMEGPGINHGSMIATIQTAKAAGFGIIILNCGQLIWSPELERAVTYQSWKCSTKKSNGLDDMHNRILGHENPENHVESSLEFFKNRLLSLGSGEEAKKGKRIYMLTYGWGCLALMKYLNGRFEEWKPSLEAVICVESTHHPTDITNPSLANFLRTRSRAYIVHSDPPGAFVPDKRFISQTFSSSQMYSECIIPNMWKDLMLPWFQRVEEDPEGCNPVLEVDWEALERLERNGGWDVPVRDDLPEDKWAVSDDEEGDEDGIYRDYDGDGLDSVVDLRKVDAAAAAEKVEREKKAENIPPVPVEKQAPSA